MPVKRAHRRDEEIDKIYISGWQGCVKVYGQIHHLNNHVRTEGHGDKRLGTELATARAAQKQQQNTLHRSLVAASVNVKTETSVRIKSVDSSKGSEAGIVILDFVITPRPGKTDDVSSFVCGFNRLNVAMSRAFDFFSRQL